MMGPIGAAGFGAGFMGSSSLMMSTPSLQDNFGMRRDTSADSMPFRSTPDLSQDELDSQSQSLATQEGSYDSLADDFTSLRTG